MYGIDWTFSSSSSGDISGNRILLRNIFKINKLIFKKPHDTFDMANPILIVILEPLVASEKQLQLDLASYIIRAIF